jgi:hypothetical protein
MEIVKDRLRFNTILQVFDLSLFFGIKVCLSNAVAALNKLIPAKKWLQGFFAGEVWA